MNAADIIARVSTEIHAPANVVWEALTNPILIKKYMFGTEVVSDFQVGSPIAWKGEWKGKRYEDKGEIKWVLPNKVLQYTHFSPLTGEEDKPENYHIVTIELVENENITTVTLTQDNNENDNAKQHSETNWKTMLDGLKKTVEAG